MGKVLSHSVEGGLGNDDYFVAKNAGEICEEMTAKVSKGRSFTKPKSIIMDRRTDRLRQER